MVPTSSVAAAALIGEQIKKVEHEQAGDPRRYAGGRPVIGNDIARRRHLWVAWGLERVGDVAWTREVVELQSKSFAEHDDPSTSSSSGSRRAGSPWTGPEWARSQSRNA